MYPPDPPIHYNLKMIVIGESGIMIRKK
jgi:hypothetical protein